MKPCFKGVLEHHRFGRTVVVVTGLPPLPRFDPPPCPGKLGDIVSGGPPPRRRVDCVGRCVAAVVLMLIPVVVVASLPSELGVLVPLGRVLD